MPKRPVRGQGAALPEALRPLFWDVDFDALRWPRDRDQVTLRVLTDGHLDAIVWLRRTLTDRGLKRWILEREGRGLDPRRLRFWQAVLALPGRRVDAWVRSMRADPWHRRAPR